MAKPRSAPRDVRDRGLRLTRAALAALGVRPRSSFETDERTASSLNSIALAVVDLEAVANELLRISNASATHRTIVDNVIEGWSNRGAA